MKLTFLTQWLLTFSVAGALVVWALVLMLIDRWKTRKRPQ